MSFERFEDFVINLDKNFKGLISIKHGKEQSLFKFPSQRDADDLFLIGSVAKQFTSSLVLLLQRRGQIRIEDRILIYFPYLKAPLAAITIQELLTHSSGLKDALHVVGEDLYSSEKFARDREFALEAYFTKAKVGEKTYHYSNFNYVIVAAIIEKVSRQTFAQVMRNELFNAAKLDKVSLCQEESWSTEENTIGYQENGSIRNSLNECSYGWNGYKGAAGVIISMDELKNWLKLVIESGFFSEDEKRLLLSSKVQTSGNVSFYGLGWEVIKESEERETAFFHGGREYGFSAFIGHHREKDLSVLVLSNTESPIVVNYFRDFFRGLQFDK